MTSIKDVMSALRRVESGTATTNDAHLLASYIAGMAERIVTLLDSAGDKYEKPSWAVVANSMRSFVMNGKGGAK
jgi:hypothetical protein